MATYSIQQIASQLDVTPADALEIVREAGVAYFTHEGTTFHADPHMCFSIDVYLSKSHRHDPTPDLEFSATSGQMAAILVSEIEQVLSDDCVALSNANGPDDPNVQRSRGLLRMLAAA